MSLRKINTVPRERSGAVWQLQSKVVQTMQQHCIVWIYLNT